MLFKKNIRTKFNSIKFFVLINFVPRQEFLFLN